MAAMHLRLSVAALALLAATTDGISQTVATGGTLPITGQGIPGYFDPETEQFTPLSLSAPTSRSTDVAPAVGRKTGYFGEVRIHPNFKINPDHLGGSIHCTVTVLLERSKNGTTEAGRIPVGTYDFAPEDHANWPRPIFYPPKDWEYTMTMICYMIDSDGITHFGTANATKANENEFGIINFPLAL